MNDANEKTMHTPAPAEARTNAALAAANDAVSELAQLNSRERSHDANEAMIALDDAIHDERAAINQAKDALAKAIEHSRHHDGCKWAMYECTCGRRELLRNLSASLRALTGAQS